MIGGIMVYGYMRNLLSISEILRNNGEAETCFTKMNMSSHN